jgi:hydroxyacylglutathione hydrolase
MQLHIEIVTVTDWAQNATIICPEGGGPGVIVDPGGELDRILGAAKAIGAQIEGILVTHGHIDHVGALPEAAEATGAPVWLHPGDLQFYERPPFRSKSIEIPKNTTHIDDGDVIEIAGLRFETLFTPGHSPGHVCFRVLDAPEPTLIGGDLIFLGSIGRTDLPGGDLRTLVRSVQEKVWVLPDETTILPGHGDKTTVGFEKKVNPFVSLEAIQDLVG